MKQPLISTITFVTPLFGVILIDTNGWLTVNEISLETAFNFQKIISINLEQNKNKNIFI